jgi:hypothetical protein
MKSATAVCLVLLVTAPAPGFAEDKPYPNFGSIAKTAGPVSQPSAPLRTEATRTVPSVPPPPAKAGCYHYGPSGWVEVSCATDAYVKEHYPHPDIQYGIASIATTTGKPLAYGLVDITFNAVGSISDSQSGTNAFSIQNNTNGFTGSNGDLDIVQFVVQSKPGQPDGVCVWNVDVKTQNYAPTCVSAPNVRGGGITAGDEPKVQGFILPGHNIGVTAYLPWAEGGASTPWAAVAGDTYDLADNWTEVSGAVLGFGNGSALTFSSADLWTEIAASTCPADTNPYANIPSSCPLQPLFYPFAQVSQPQGASTMETNNLVSPPSSPVITWPNNDLALLGYPEMVPIPGCKLNTVTTRVAETGSNDNISEVTSTVDPRKCPTSPPLSMQILNLGNGFTNGIWVSLPQYCSDGSPPSTCSPSAIVPNEFVLGTQKYGATQSGASVGTTQTVRVCDSASQCSPFTLTIPVCPSLPSASDQLSAANCFVTLGQGLAAGGNVACMVFMNGPWVAADNGVNATGVVSLPPQLQDFGCTGYMSLGSRNTSGGILLSGGLMELIMSCPLSATPVPPNCFREPNGSVKCIKLPGRQQ